MQEGSKPQAGDVLFFKRDDIETKHAGLVQRMLDRDARWALRTFGHVAIALDGVLALEAVPAEPNNSKNNQFKLPNTTELSDWSGCELRGGVRLAPIADLVIHAMRTKSDFVVLRGPKMNPEVGSILGPVSPFVVRLLGSQYSLEALKREAKAIFGETLTGLVASNFNWTSIPIDIATKIDLGAKSREQIAAMLPKCALPDAARTYYCSQLAICSLQACELFPPNVATDLTLPTGLYRLLHDRGWHDVTHIYRCGPEPKSYFRRTPASTAAYYTECLAMNVFAASGIPLELEVTFIAKALERATQLCEDVMRRLGVSSSQTPSPPDPGT
jgi:hypothetical protein